MEVPVEEGITEIHKICQGAQRVVGDHSLISELAVSSMCFTLYLALSKWGVTALVLLPVSGGWRVLEQRHSAERCSFNNCFLSYQMDKLPPPPIQVYKAHEPLVGYTCSKLGGAVAEISVEHSGQRQPAGIRSLQTDRTTGAEMDHYPASTVVPKLKSIGFF